MASDNVPSDGAAAPAVLIPNVSTRYSGQVYYIKNTRQRVIQWLAVQFKSTKERKDLSKVPQLEQLLLYLDNCVVMTPQLRKDTCIDKGLDLIIDPKYCFPARFVEAATQLKQKWTDENWGADAVVDDGSDNEDPAAPASPTTAGGDALTIRPPPRDHPIFGEHGIMHGVVITQGRHGNRVYRRNPNYKPRSAMVFGDNGLEVGAWWPMQMVALFHGAHGSSQGGIAGSARLGAYSIVIAGTYDALDDDRGDVVRYSGSASHKNRDPSAAGKRSGFTQALHTSLARGHPLRVLRSASARKSTWSPSVGIRYDGLYRIARVLLGHNEFGGAFEQFELQRLDGQPPLEQVIRSSPTAQQRHDFTLIAEGY